jgi:uncharacterized membrane protein YeaQ/YmgE (transglycosylase-associated protein family)
MSIIAWVIFGALAGWIASLVMNTDEQQGGLANIAVGIIGAIIGGYLSRFVGGSGVTGFNIGSLLIAVLGAVVLLGVYKAFSSRA